MKSGPLDKFLMSDEQRAARRLSIGGSDANTIMGGNADYLMELWEEKRGIAKPKQSTLSMLIGTVTEELNAAWYTHVTGDAVTSRGYTNTRKLQNLPMHATLDGRCKLGDSVWEAKHTSGYDFASREKRTIEGLAEQYMPQLQHNMYVERSQSAVLSVFFDNSRHEFIEIAADPFYQDMLIDREIEFWNSVQSGKAPKERPAMKAKPEIVASKAIDFTGNNEWASFAAEWLANKEAASKFDSATSGIKAMVEADAAKAFGHGIVALRDKRGIRISKA